MDHITFLKVPAQVAEKILIPAVASPVAAGIAAPVATHLAYRLTTRAREKPPTNRRDGRRFGAAVYGIHLVVPLFH
ncbi:hypothetical protein ACWEBX_29630 [Streptomyces sp. NPDC005070]